MPVCLHRRCPTLRSSPMPLPERHRPSHPPPPPLSCRPFLRAVSAATVVAPFSHCGARCRGRREELVDDFVICESWEHEDTTNLKEPKTISWLKRFIGRAKKPEMRWSFPFIEGKLFVLTIHAGVEGYHIYVGGRHISSFPQDGISLEDATGLPTKGDVAYTQFMQLLFQLLILASLFNKY